MDTQTSFLLRLDYYKPKQVFNSYSETTKHIYNKEYKAESEIWACKMSMVIQNK